MKNFVATLIISSITMLYSSCNNSREDINRYKSKLAHKLENAAGPKERLKVLDSMYKASSNVKGDSLRGQLLLEIGYQYSKLSDTTSFLKANEEAREKLKKARDTLGLAASYWDLGNHFENSIKYDSAYYYYNRAQSLYDSQNKNYHRGRILLNMAIIQKNIGDYIGSERTSIEAIQLLRPFGKPSKLFAAYNNLGLLFTRLEDKEKALKYFEEAKNYLSINDNKEDLPSLWNNIGRVYNQNGEFEKAQKSYKKALHFNVHLNEDNPELYAIILDNYAYSRFLAGEAETVLKDFYDALNIRKQHQIIDGVIISQLHLAEFFERAGDSSKAEAYALKAKFSSSETANLRDYLASLRILAKVDPPKGLYYLKEHIIVSDSLYKKERAMRDKFSRIRFETDMYIEKNQVLNERVWFLSVAIFLLIIMTIMLYIIKTERVRNKLARQQKKANEDIYQLVLAQHKKFEEGRDKEKIRISRELHDGILGELFGVQLSLDSLNEEDSEESKNERYHYIDKIQKIAEEIRIISHQLQQPGSQDVNFPVLLEALIRELDGEIKFHLQLDKEIDWNLISDTIKMNIYRIIQESSMNIIKHSQAITAKVKVLKDREQLIIQVSDDGKGFNSKNFSKGIGLQNIKSRVSELKGSQMELTSGDSGTVLKIEMNII